jgi:hypothetical protein
MQELRRLLYKNRSCGRRGWRKCQTSDNVLLPQLLLATEMRRYFPDAELHWRKFFGLPKSMIVVKIELSLLVPRFGAGIFSVG